jgi:general secretion pathway protein G
MAGFTLIEIMVVVMIIGMLAALVGVRVYERFGTAQREVTAGQIRNLMTALDSYFLDNGRYPTAAQGLDALVQKPGSAPVPKNYPTNGYIDQVPLDPWGNEYVYNAPGINGGPYSIKSYGADGLEGGEAENADIESWNLSGD